MISRKRLLIFTDLDGTLLDYHSYSYEPAIDALSRLNDLRIPLILCSSKTRTEICKLRTAIDNHCPFIVENGSTVIVPANSFESIGALEHVEVFGLGYNDLLIKLHWLRQSRGYQFQGFNDLSDAKLAEITGLTLENAKNAKQRSSSEPIQWQSTEEDLAQFQSELESMQLKLIQGGRFYHVMGQTDKVEGMKWLIHLYQRNDPRLQYITVALGDSPNDEAMLRAVDIPVVIKSAKGECLAINDCERVIYSQAPGPTGWRTAVLEILDRYY